MNQDIREIRQEFDMAIAGSYDKNRKVNEDYMFAFIPGEQWQGSYAEQFANRPKPENNQVARAIHRILGQYERLELNARIASNSDDATDEDAELLQSRWRNDFNISNGIEALNNAAKEAFSGGFGAVKIVNKYEDEENPDPQKQYMCVEPIYSAASSIVFDAGAISKDKSDAKRCWQLLRVNKKDIEEEYDVDIAPFPNATTDYFDWNCYGSTKDVYIAHYWEVRHTKITCFDFNNGEMVIERRGRKYFDENGQQIDKEDFEAIKELYEYTETKKKVKEVWYSLIDGKQYLTKPQRTPFKRVPVIPQYGYYSVVNGIEYYCGEVAGSRDPQMYDNMYFSSLMQIMGQNPIEIPEYLPEQVAGPIAQNIANEQKNNSAMRITQPVKDQAGNILQAGPVSVVQPPQIGTGLAAAGQYLSAAQQMQSGTGQSTLPSNTSGDAIQQVNERQDDTYQPLMQNAMQAINALCQVWIPAAKELYFSDSRKLRVMSEDGGYSQVETMQYDTVNGEYGPYKNTAKGQYDVTVKAGESHKTKKEADRMSALEILQYVDTTTPKGQMALNTAIMSTTGEGTQTIRKVARFEEMQILMSMNIDPQPKTDEEKQYIQMLMQQQQMQAQQQQPDPMLLAAQAEQMKAESDMMDSQVKAFEAETRRADVQVKAQKAGAEIALKTAQTNGAELDNIIKLNGGQ